MLCHLESKQGGRLIGECISRKRKSTKIDWKFKHTQHYVSRVWLTILHIGWLNLELALALTRDMCHHISCFFLLLLWCEITNGIYLYTKVWVNITDDIYIYLFVKYFAYCSSLYLQSVHMYICIILCRSDLILKWCSFIRYNCASHDSNELTRLKIKMCNS